jgi:hypothetical protein
MAGHDKCLTQVTPHAFEFCYELPNLGRLNVLLVIRVIAGATRMSVEEESQSHIHKIKFLLHLVKERYGSDQDQGCL